MQKSKKSIIVLMFFTITQNLVLAQEWIEDFCDSTLYHNGYQFSGKYVLSDFQKYHPELPVGFNNLTIRFDSSNIFRANGANAHRGLYFVNESNRINIIDCISTIVSVEHISKSGIRFPMSLYYDTLLNCNRFQVINDEIKFYRDKNYRLTFKEFYSFLGFASRDSLQEKKVSIIKIDSCKLTDDYVLVNDPKQLNDLEVSLDNYEINFKEKSIILVKHLSLYEARHMNLRGLIRKYKRRNRLNNFGKFNAKEFYPLPHAKLYANSDSTFYLDVINTYSRGFNGIAYQQRRIYSGFITDKIKKKEDLVINIRYTE